MYSPKASGGKVYVSGINTRINAGDTVIFTSDLGKVSASEYNFRYTRNVVAAWNGSAYIVKSITTGSGDNTPDITLGEGEILIASHDWEIGAENPVVGSHANFLRLSQAKVGDTLSFVGIDLENKTLAAAPVILLPEYEAEFILGDVNNDGEINQYDYLLIKRQHFGTRLLTDDETSRADVNRDGKVDQYDYLLIARHYFGTYVIV